MNQFPTLNTIVPVKEIHGKFLMDVPADLYIPPDALEIFLDTFQGPLDLLLYLIRKNNLEILDIPMAELTRQYMSYVEIMRANQLELAVEYLLMAAVLIEIKSRMLLPCSNSKDTEGDIDPRATLARRLIEYEKIKLAASRLNDLPQAERDFALVKVPAEKIMLRCLPEVSANDLHNAWLALFAGIKNKSHYHVTREKLSVRAHMSRIMRQLRGREFIKFHELFNPTFNIAELVVTFIALLELVRETLVEVTQSNVFGIIYVRSTNPISAI
ncbi:MAG: ScpA family protein [Nitrosomonadaceae bacterium]|nr:ScpA family protein [Nitrosomonadaceae bacterium]MDW7653454.1 ScpA family protein [Nitrosomonadaceae bacterium]MDW7663325.1 ScpA family protein [Nitrosomonadaceae bacterium]MDW7665519.1 ScpA family protein [Nitrosomonadaceae bacterium]